MPPLSPDMESGRSDRDSESRLPAHGVDRAGDFHLSVHRHRCSTRLWQADRDAMSAALAVHDETLNRIVQDSGDAVFKHTGDGVCAVFSSPRAALAAAKIAQADLELPVRMGVHSGEAEERDGDYFGPALNRCSWSRAGAEKNTRRPGARAGRMVKTRRSCHRRRGQRRQCPTR